MSQFKNSFASIYGNTDWIAEFQAATKKQTQYNGTRLGFTLVDQEPVIHCVSDYLREDYNGLYLYFGFAPMHLRSGCMIKYGGRSTNPYSITYATWHFDISNCGVGHIHNIRNAGTRGMGSHVLRFLESYFERTKRRYITCTVSSIQVGADEWLIKKGYKEVDSFVGGNSGNDCKLFVKDLSKSPIVTAKELNV